MGNELAADWCCPFSDTRPLLLASSPARGLDASVRLLRLMMPSRPAALRLMCSSILFWAEPGHAKLWPPPAWDGDAGAENGTGREGSLGELSGVLGVWGTFPVFSLIAGLTELEAWLGRMGESRES